MTTVNSTTYAAQEAGKIALDAGINHTKLLVASTSYECAATAANTEINLFKLPKGAKIHNFIVAHDDMGTGITLDIGDAADGDRYVDGLAIATAAGSTAGILPDGCGYAIGTATEADDTVVIAKIIGGAATGTLKVVCEYAI